MHNTLKNIDMPRKQSQTTEGVLGDQICTGRLVSPDELARRWSVSRSTVIRVLDSAGISAVFLSGAKRGVRRYRMSDISAYEASLVGKD